MPYPYWLWLLSWLSLGLSAIAAVMVLLDVLRHHQKMAVMNVVWPITALYGGPLGLWLYYRYAPSRRKNSTDNARAGQTSVAVSHCGAGCTLGDIVGETLIAATGVLIFSSTFATRTLIDFLFAWLFGIGFQYFSIVPMRHLTPMRGIVEAMKVDTISIVAFQIGMTAWMLVVNLVLFPSPHLQPTSMVFWFMMQIAMVIGFLTAYPANVWLLKSGWKEKM